MTKSSWTSTTWKAATSAGLAALALGSIAGPAVAGAPSLVGQWRFDEGAGQIAVDDGPFHLDGRLGAADGPDAADPERIPGASGGALRFDGGSYVSLPAAPQLALQALSVETVVRAPASPGRWRYVVSRGGRDCVSSSYGLYTAAGRGIALYVFDGSRYVVSATARPSDVWDGAWHRVAGTFDGRSLRLYVDGRPVGTPMDAPLTIDYATTSDRGTIGQYAGACDLAFRGDVDLVRLTAGALGPDAIFGAAEGTSPPAGDSREPLPAADPGTVLPAQPADGAPAATPAPTCVVHLSRTRVVARRKSVVRVRVTPSARRATVVARRTSNGKAVAKARTSASGVARLVVKAQRSGHLTIAVAGRPGCLGANLRVGR
jgi:hypothetical protein